MPTAPARPANRVTVDKRSILINLEHPIIGQDYAGPDREPIRFTIETVMIDALRDVTRGDSAWALGEVATRGYVQVNGEPTGLSARREYHPNHVQNRRYHHADMPTELAKLVHDELAAPDTGDDPAVSYAVEVAGRIAAGNGEEAIAATVLLNERLNAWAALPESVRGDAAPAGATLAQRIEALVAERDREHTGFARCHARHRHVEAAADAVGNAFDAYDPAVPEPVRKALDGLTEALVAVRSGEDLAAPTLTIRWDDDEQITISLPGHDDLIIANHDRHGWDGMQAAIDVTTAMAKALGLPVVTEGVPNL